MLRERVASGDGLGREVASLMQAGSLVPDQTVNRLVEERIEQPDCEHGFILDGYPRTVDQARLLAGLLSAKQVSPLVVHLKVDYNVIVARLSGRRLCPTCGALYGMTPNVPTAEVCDYDGSKLVVREDDREEVVRARLEAYERQTAPVLDFLKGAGYAFLEIEGDGNPQVIAGRIGKFVEDRVKIGNARARV
jgi:adenylate kinase